MKKASKKSSSKKVTLNKALSLPMLVLYGLGTMVGGGIYALIGKVAGEAGALAPLSFLIAAFIACLTALAYCELSARHPVSAGVSHYIYEAFQKSWLAKVLGWAVIFTGLISCSTLVKAGAGFLFDLNQIPEFIGGFAIILFLFLLAFWGILQSAVVISIISFVEVMGLLVVTFSARESFGKLPEFLIEQSHFIMSDGFVLGALFSGAFLAFYAFIGFEDMVNVAEEVKDVEKTLPKAIIIAFSLTTVLYMLISFAGILSVDIETLKTAKTPLAAITGDHEHLTPTVIGLLSLIAGLNGALVQIIMISRILYGMAQENRAPALFKIIHAKTQTPLYATAFTALTVFVLSSLLAVENLASIASGVILIVFIFVNVSLVLLKRKNKKIKTFSIPFWVPVLGTICCLILLGSKIVSFL